VLSGETGSGVRPISEPESARSRRKSAWIARSTESLPDGPIRPVFLPQLSIAGLAAGGVKRRIGACKQVPFRPESA